MLTQPCAKGWGGFSSTRTWSLQPWDPVVVVNCDMLMTGKAEMRSFLSQNIICLPCKQSSRTEWCHSLCSDMESPYRLLLTEGVLISLLYSSWHNFSCITKQEKQGSVGRP